MITDDDFIHLPELYLKFGDLKKYLDNLYNLKIYTMNYEELAKKNVWGLEAEDIKTIEEDGFFDGGGHWIFNNVDGSYEAVYDGNYMHVFGSLEDLMARENEVAYYEYSSELSEENGEETFVNAEGKIREYTNGDGVGSDYTPSNVDKAIEDAGKIHNAHTSNGGNLNYSEKRYEYLSELLDSIDIGYLKREPDGDAQQELADQGFTMTADEVIESVSNELNSIKDDVGPLAFYKAIYVKAANGYKMANGGGVDKSDYSKWNEAMAKWEEAKKKGDKSEAEKQSKIIKEITSKRYSNGGGVPDYVNKTKEQIWNSWTKEQRIHFIQDHDRQGRNAEEIAEFSYDDIHDTNISDWIGEHIEMGQYKNGGGIGVEYNYEILAKNTLTGEENVVCQVRMFGDVPHIIKGLQNAVGSSPIKYIHKNIENKAAQGMFLEGEFEEIVAKTKAYVDKYPYVWTKGNKSYVPIEGWQYAASLMGLSARVSEVTPMPEKNGWMAKAEVVNQNGVVVCSGFGFVGRDEPKWANAPETDLEAFAQTKAVSRALRNCISYLIKAAGYSTTPAEEMYGIKTPKKSGVKPFVSKTTEEDFIFDKPEYKFPEEQKVSSVFARSTQPPIVKAEKKDEGKFYALLKEMYHNAVSTGITIKSKEFMEEIDATLFAHGDTEEDYRLMIADGFSWLLDNGFVLKSRIFMNKIRSAIAYARLD